MPERIPFGTIERGVGSELIKDKKSGDSHDIYNHGQAVVARFGGRKKYHEGTIIYHNADGTYAIQYGDVTESEKKKCSLPLKTECCDGNIFRKSDKEKKNVVQNLQKKGLCSICARIEPIFEIWSCLPFARWSRHNFSLENEGTDDARILLFTTLTGTVTTAVFVLECVQRLSLKAPSHFDSSIMLMMATSTLLTF